MMPEIAELALIDRIRRSSKSRNGAVRVGIGDDCAVLRVPAGHEMVVTTDMFLEGRHFRRDWHSPHSAGHRCLARGLSDVAAMGGRPLAAFLSIALPKGFNLGWLDGFMEGFEALAAKYEVELAGGDTAEAPGAEILADIVVVGAVAEGKALLRSGARAGDGLYVTGSLGGSAVELEQMQAGSGTRGAGRQSFPEPRLAVSTELPGFATSCMDLSDGISLDLRRLCKASNCGAEIWESALPLEPGASLQQALHGGEDYELLFTARDGAVPSEIAGIKLTRIGNMGGDSVRMLTNEGKSIALAVGGWEHFRA